MEKKKYFFFIWEKAFEELGILVELEVLCFEEWTAAESSFDDCQGILQAVLLDKAGSTAAVLDGADAAVLVATDRLDGDSYWLASDPFGVVSPATLGDAGQMAFALGHALGGDLRRPASGGVGSETLGYRLKSDGKNGTVY